MRKVLVGVVLLFASLAITSAAMADNLQFGPIAVSFCGTSSSACSATVTGPNGGSDLKLSTSTVTSGDFGTVPGDDTAIGDTVSFGSNPVAYFDSLGGGIGTLTNPQTITIGSILSTGGKFSGDLSSITLGGSNGSFTLTLGVVNGAFLAGTGTASVNLQDLASTGSGQALITFQLAGTGASQVSDLIDPSVNQRFTGSGSISAVPEPSSMLVLGSGLLGLAGARRRWF